MNVILDKRIKLKGEIILLFIVILILILLNSVKVERTNVIHHFCFVFLSQN